MTWRLVVAGVAMGVAAPALAVGLGPLRKEGVTDGPAKAFYLTLYNPYDQRASFELRAFGADDEDPAPRVHLPAPMAVAAKSSRKVTVYVGDLTPGESYTFRVCAERLTFEEEPIHARVCSRLTARRLIAAG